MTNLVKAVIALERAKLHQEAAKNLLGLRKDGLAPNFSDGSDRLSRELGSAVLQKLTPAPSVRDLPGQTAGKLFEKAIAVFLERSFMRFGHLRPGRWEVARGRSIARYSQYQHLKVLEEIAHEKEELATAIGSDYIIVPDVVISRAPEPESAINAQELLVDGSACLLSPLRESNDGAGQILHASVSCKYTIRADRAQNSRSEGLNLVRNRKGRLPHVAVVTAEPRPSRLAAIALGTGDIDCVYHFALYELQSSLAELDFPDASDSVDMMVRGKRLRDISDLPLDLCI